jgi:hypothetical protein
MDDWAGYRGGPTKPEGDNVAVPDLLRCRQKDEREKIA